jgi:hypothetical protein
MKNLDNFIYNQFMKFINELSYDTKMVKNDIIWQYRFLCFKLNYFIRYIPLQKIKQKKLYEAVLIEFRILPNIEFVLRNAILKLGKNWSFTIVCGNTNYKFIKDIVKSVNEKIKIIQLNYDNLTQEEYSNLLMTENFWNLFHGEKILIYQEDSLLFHNNIYPFLEYDFIGAPFAKNTNDTPNCVGNGGLSIRTKYKMLKTIKICKPQDTILNSSTINYMALKNLKTVPEDVYFSKNMQEFKIGDVANWDIAYDFSSEQVFNPKSFGGHKYWMSNPNWKIFTLKLFNYNVYIPKSDLNKYLAFKKIPLNFNRTKDLPNAFDIDIEFFCCVNNLKYINDYESLKYIYTFGLDGFIYHPKQLYNIIDDKLKFYTFLNNIYTYYNNNIYAIQDLVNKYIYNSDFNYLSQLLIKKKYDTINDNYDTTLLVFIGNKNIGINLVEKIINYKNINQNFNVAFCVNKNILEEFSEIKEIIKKNFDFYAIYISKELGTDITPTLLMYNEIIKTHSSIKNIIKLHTKTISNIYNNLTDYLLNNSINRIQQDKIHNCNCICSANEYLNLSNDNFNIHSKNKFMDKINMDYCFVKGTMFYCENIVFEKTLEFMKNNNFRAFLLNNLYENNSINDNYSPIHFLERVFGSIKL